MLYRIALSVHVHSRELLFFFFDFFRAPHLRSQTVERSRYCYTVFFGISNAVVSFLFRSVPRLVLVVAFRLSVVTSRPVHALSAVAVALPVSTLGLAFPRPHGPRSNSPRARLSPYRPGGLMGWGKSPRIGSMRHAVPWRSGSLSPESPRRRAPRV